MSRKKKSEKWGQNGFEEWGGYMEAKKAKLEEQFLEGANQEHKGVKSDILKGIAIFVNGYTNPTADEIRRLMMAHGGIYHHYMRPRITTHIIASNLPYSKIVVYKKSSNPVPIVKPEWIVDSIAAGKVLNYQNYLLYANSTEMQSQLNFLKKENNLLSRVVKKSNSVVEPVSVIEESHNLDQIKSKNNLNIAETINPTSTKNQACCSKDSNFLSEFYNNSRLHHIATMGATFKEYINELRDKHDGVFSGLNKLIDQKSQKIDLAKEYGSDSDDELFISEKEQNAKKVDGTPIIMHIDMDCFFVSVGIRNKPELKGLPVAVTHSKGKHISNSTNNSSDKEEYGSMSEIASCSYEARKFGLKNGMFLGQALKLCPNLKTIQYDFEAYKEVSFALYDTVASYTLDIEAVSCDEMYTDCSKILKKSRMTPLEFATVIRSEIKEKTGCPVSTGFGSNKLQARLATKKAKPDGQFYLSTENVEAYIGGFNVKDLPGVGYTTAKKLNKLHVETCADLRNISLIVLQKEFGKKTGEMLYNICRGIDNSKLNSEHVRKSISAEINYGIRFENNADAVDFLQKLCIEVCTRLKKVQAKGRSIVLKLMIRAREAPVDPVKFMGHGLCDYLTKSKNLITAVDDVNIIVREVINLWNQAQQVPQDIRGIGVQINRLEIAKNKTNGSNLSNFINKLKSDSIETNEKKILSKPFSVEECKSKSLKSFFTNTSNKNEIDKKSDNLFVIQKNGITSNNNDNLPLCNKIVEVTSTNVQNNDAKIRINEKVDISTILSSKLTSENAGANTSSSEKKGFNNFSTFSMSDVDDEVLKELPEDIRNEILSEYRERNNICHRKQCSEVDQSKNGKVESNEVLEEITAESSVINAASLDESCFLVPSQEIDKSILNQLPEDMRVEIVAIQSKKRGTLEEKKEKPASQTQKKQLDYFKQVKPSSSKSVKVQLPSLREIDMCVLAELPEDIRNEIFNEYNANKLNNNADLPDTASEPKAESSKPKLDKTEMTKNNNLTEENLTFSQIDPDYLAALTDDMRSEVQMYCNSIKRQKEKGKSNAQAGTKGLQCAWNVMRQNKAESIPKSKKSSKSAKSTSNKKFKKKSPKVILQNVTSIAEKQGSVSEKERVPTVQANIVKSPVIQINEVNNALPSTSNKIDNVFNAEDEDLNIIISHYRSISNSSGKANDYEETIVNQVREMLEFPLEEIQVQIQTWIVNSKTIKEEDYLSLTTFLSVLPGIKRIEDLHVLLKTMHRCTMETGSCIWHKTYKKIVNYVQHYMQIEYNSNLMVPLIGCNLFKCNNDDVL